MNMSQFNGFSSFLCMVMHVEGGEGGVDCEQSLFFFRFSGGSASGLDGPRKERDYA